MTDSRDRPIVLGGGMAGIAAAMELADRGASPILVESRPYLGGRVRSFIHQETGDEIDNGRHLLIGCYHKTFDLLRKLGTDDLVTIQPALRVEFRTTDNSDDTLISPSWLPPPLHVLAGMFRLKQLSFRERAGLLRVGLDVKRKGPHENETVAQYLGRLDQSKRTQQRLWSPLVIATLNTRPEEASARLFAAVMRLAFLSKPHDSKLAIPRVGLSRLIAPGEEYITSRGGRIFSGRFVAHIVRIAKEWEVHLRDGMVLRTSTVLSALPWRESSTLLGEHLPRLQKGPSPSPYPGEFPRHNPIVSVYLWFDRSLEEMPEFNAMLGTQVEWMFNRRKISGEKNQRFPGLLECVVSAADTLVELDNGEIVAIAEKELRAAFRELEGANLIASQVVKEKRATFHASPDINKARPVPGSLGSGLFVAGDWTATGLPGTIEGAVRSGLIAARQICERESEQ